MSAKYALLQRGVSSASSDNGHFVHDGTKSMTGDAPAIPHADHGALAAAEHGLARSPHWPHVRAEQLRRQPACQATGLTEADGANLEAHHRYAFHLAALVGRPDLELDLRNLITLARGPAIDAHLLLGHLDDFRSYNPDVAEDCVIWHGKTEAEIKDDPRWRAKHAERPKPWAEWTFAEKADFKAELDRLFPPAVVILPQAA